MVRSRPTSLQSFAFELGYHTIHNGVDRCEAPEHRDDGENAVEILYELRLLDGTGPEEPPRCTVCAWRFLHEKREDDARTDSERARQVRHVPQGFGSGLGCGTVFREIRPDGDHGFFVYEVAFRPDGGVVLGHVAENDPCPVCGFPVGAADVEEPA